MINGFCHFGRWGSFADFGVWEWTGLLLNPVFWVGLIVGLTLLVLRAARHFQVPTATTPSVGGQLVAKEILQFRYIRGEITREQYQQMLDDMR